jgi:hypothetical protein
MPYFKTSQEWLDQSALLLEARPATTRVTTKYSIKPVKPRKTTTTDGDSSAAESNAPAKLAPRASLVLKTYDPVSGVTLKFRTTKAAEVSRLVYASLGRLGRGMAAVPAPPELAADEAMPDAPGVATPTEGGASLSAAAAAAAPAATAAQQAGGGGAGGGGKKKKKGKK